MMLNFAAALRSLGTNAAVRIANAIRPMPEYLFNTLLPERNMPTYDVKGGQMVVRATMAGLVGMDSPFPPTGTVETSTFAEQTAKIANNPYLPEAAIRQLQAFMQSVNGGNAPQSAIDLSQEALNFLNKVVLQPHIDTAEYLRGEALVYGALDWTFNQKRLQVSYGFPSANLLTARTGTAGYGGSASTFWTDIRSMRSLLRYNVRAFIAHPETIDMILRNTANALAVTAQEGSQFTVRRFVSVNAQNTLSNDARDTVTLIGYDKEGEILDLANPGKTVRVPFMPQGKLLAVGNNNAAGYRVGQGSTDDPAQDAALGYTHIGPTVEGNGAPGRWSDLRVPDDMPMQLHGRGVSNIMPVIEAYDKVVVGTTDMA